MSFDLGDSVLELLEGSEGPVTLVAPFIKVKVLAKLLSTVNDERIVVYTRWQPAEVAAGVSDLEVLDLLADRPNSELWLVRELHAKAFIRGSDALLGSANLTGAALGWSTRPNLELLVQAAAETPELTELLRHLNDLRVEATVKIQRSVRRAAEDLHGDPVTILTYLTDGAWAPSTDWGSEDGPEADWPTPEAQRPALWVPEFPDPRRLVDYFLSGEQLSVSGEQRAERDLCYLQVAARGSDAELIAAIREALQQASFVSIVRKAYNDGGTHEDAKQQFARALGMEDDEDADDHWNTAVQWLVFFFSREFATGPTEHGLIRYPRSQIGTYG
ncbi:MAG: phospholipase D family protein [Dehalococcoidia bacterium]